MSEQHDPWTSQAKPVEEQKKTGEPEQWMQAWAKEVLLEQRRARRGRLIGGIFRGVLTLAVLLLVFGSGKQLLSPATEVSTSGEHLALVDIKGTIEADGRASAVQVLQGVERAFKAPGAKAVVLRINSPGGSPVQAGQIYEGVVTLKKSNPELPVYAVIEDLGASGGYYVAVAADTIFADRASLVGSIGVVSGGFGFKEAMERLGIERRVFTSGENKAFLDPFTEMNAEQRAFWQTVLDSTHQQFIERVKEGRGERLVNNPQIFSGLVWNGELALEQGLIDELGSVFSLQSRLGLERTVNYTPEPNPWQLIEKRLGTAFKSALIELAAPSY
ncbi:S49 family peptidase [Marinospirillum insulare]|uniref:Peptidase n=1 Tax=Marinospirillum insulare TaxID=217169 RepID=A0ABQ6A3X3_9GAMM|nr:S49 family peptidase [Marinospirillum insulare]GLR65272.1 peptidase [Marinospirillum insulare]